jgi:hypothetical protein
MREPLLRSCFRVARERRRGLFVFFCRIAQPTEHPRRKREIPGSIP